MKKKIIVTVLLVGLLFGGWATWYVFFKPHRNIAAEKPKYELSADSLSLAFKDNMSQATAKYINQAVLIQGSITNIEGKTVSLNNVACNIDSTDLAKLSSIKVGNPIKIQGLVVGYNDLMEEISLADCTFK